VFYILVQQLDVAEKVNTYYSLTDIRKGILRVVKVVKPGLIDAWQHGLKLLYKYVMPRSTPDVEVSDL